MCIYFRLKKRLFLFLLGYACIPLFSVAITLLNDSAYTLNAQIVDATGRHLALVHLVPGQMYIYDAMQGTFQRNTNQPYTPFTVTFLCQSNRPYDYSTPKKQDPKDKGKEKPKKSQYISQFGIWTAVPRGALVNALGCPTGTKSCVMKKHPKLSSKRKSSENTNAGMNNWSNDGGITWSNDSGPGWFDCPQDGSPCQRRDTPSFGTRNESSKWTNSTELTVQNAYGEDWGNDKDNTWANDQNSTTIPAKEKTSSEKTHSELGFFSNDSSDNGENKGYTPDHHTPTVATPLPFKERNPN